NPGEVHDGRPLGGPSRRWRMVYFDPGVIAAALDVSGHDIELAQPVLRDARLATAFRCLVDRIERWSEALASDLHRLACDEALVTACALLTHRPAPVADSRHDPVLTQAHDHLADGAGEAPSLATLAHEAGLSKYQLLRRFASAYGITPHAWLLQRRAEQARSLIVRGEGLAQAAAAAGFADQSHMTRIFARQFGFTPGAWQRAVAPRAPASSAALGLQ
ncbi:MAG: transcriptional regulator, AraC family-like protein, partial [Rhodoferax sp.]|nr:transcriptional regulator, AraC family-like protein [Rhodoferax sp.]